jgi:aspartate aminotransferase-like enzyme
MILPDEYITRVAEAVHSVGGLMVLDCIASGTVWVDMQKCGVDALISAPQKGWTGPSCAGLVMLSERGADVARATRGSSFVCDLRKWLELMDSYEAGGFMYHATMPTDALVTFRDVMLETQQFGFQNATDKAWELGGLVRKMMCEEKGLVSVAAPGYQAPGVVVVHTSDSAIPGKFIKAGTQIAAGVPFMIGEPSDTKTFRIGLFGLDKLKNPTKTAGVLNAALEQAVPDEVVKNLSGYIKSDTSLKKAMPQ